MSELQKQKENIDFKDLMKELKWLSEEVLWVEYIESVKISSLVRENTEGYDKNLKKFLKIDNNIA